MAYEPAPAPAPPAPVSYEPPPLQGPPSVVVDLNANELAAERTARQSAEQERDAYGARMAELHGELRTLREATDAERARLLTDLSNAQRRVQQLEAQLGTGDPAAVAAEARANAALEELAQVTDQLKSAEARERSMEEELGVARTDLEAAEQRIVSELAAHEEQLTVTRADLIKAEERILDLSRTVSELEQKLATR
jgi:chromosome segregation ATPase